MPFELDVRHGMLLVGGQVIGHARRGADGGAGPPVGLPVSGSSTIRQGSENVCSISSSVTTSVGGRPPASRPSFMTIRWSAYRIARLSSCITTTTSWPGSRLHGAAQLEHVDLVEPGRGRSSGSSSSSVPSAGRAPSRARPAAARRRTARRPMRWANSHHLRGGHRLVDDDLVVAGPLAQQLLVRVAAARDQVRDGDPLGRDRALREQTRAGEPRPWSARRGCRYRPAARVPRVGPEHPGQRLEQRRLPAAVGADDHRQLAARDQDVEALGDHDRVVRQRGVPGRPARGASPGRWSPSCRCVIRSGSFLHVRSARPGRRRPAPASRRRPGAVGPGNSFWARCR